MPEPLRPAKTNLFGRRNWIILPTIASATLAPTVAEITSASALDITRILFANNTDEPSMNTDSVEEERRWGDTETYESIGETKYTGGMLAYVFGAQAAAGADGKKLYEMIPAGYTGFLADRMGISRATTPIAGQFTNIYPIEFGPSFIQPQGEGVTGQSSARCRFAITGPIGQNKAILA